MAFPTPTTLALMDLEEIELRVRLAELSQNRLRLDYKDFLSYDDHASRAAWNIETQQINRELLRRSEVAA